MDFKQIIELIKLVNDSEIADFRMREGDFELKVTSGKYRPDITKTPVLQTVQVSPAEMPAAPKAAPAPAAPNKEFVPDLPNTGAESGGTDTANLLEVKSPIVGTFYRSSAPEKPPYIKVGDTIQKGDVVCIVEAMKLFNEIESEISGKIVKVMVEDAAPVEYDQVLFLVEPA